MPAEAASFIDGIGAVADRYAGFVLDQGGVLHDGRAPYPGVLEALAELKRRGKRLVLLSNSGRRVEFSRRHLSHIGFQVEMFDAIVTSGETAWEILRDGHVAPFDRLGRRCFLITRDGDREVVADTGVVIVETIEAADFLFLAGVDSPTLGLDDYRPTLAAAAARDLPCLCSNPDLHAPTGGGLVLAPGGLAAVYEDLGGEVLYVGKPHAPIYDACFVALRGLGRDEIVAIGDSLDHDIRGANAAGIDSVLIAGGLHAADFPVAASLEARRATLGELALRHRAQARWVAPRFAW